MHIHLEKLQFVNCEYSLELVNLLGNGPQGQQDSTHQSRTPAGNNVNNLCIIFYAHKAPVCPRCLKLQYHWHKRLKTFNRNGGSKNINIYFIVSMTLTRLRNKSRKHSDSNHVAGMTGWTEGPEKSMYVRIVVGLSYAPALKKSRG